jgi:hypothetical protein
MFKAFFAAALAVALFPGALCAQGGWLEFNSRSWPGYLGDHFSVKIPPGFDSEILQGVNSVSFGKYNRYSDAKFDGLGFTMHSMILPGPSPGHMWKTTDGKWMEPFAKIVLEGGARYIEGIQSSAFSMFKGSPVMDMLIVRSNFNRVQIYHYIRLREVMTDKGMILLECDSLGSDRSIMTPQHEVDQLCRGFHESFELD